MYFKAQFDFVFGAHLCLICHKLFSAVPRGLAEQGVGGPQLSCWSVPVCPTTSASNPRMISFVLLPGGLQLEKAPHPAPALLEDAMLSSQ